MVHKTEEEPLLKTHLLKTFGRSLPYSKADHTYRSHETPKADHSPYSAHDVLHHFLPLWSVGLCWFSPPDRRRDLSRVSPYDWSFHHGQEINSCWTRLGFQPGCSFCRLYRSTRYRIGYLLRLVRNGQHMQLPLSRSYRRCVAGTRSLARRSCWLRSWRWCCLLAPRCLIPWTCLWG